MNNTERALANSEKARNSNIEHFIATWELDGVYLPPETLKTLRELATPPESILRKRRTLQANGKYLANENVRKFRAEKAKEAHDTMGESISQTPSENPAFPKFGCKHCSKMQRNNNWREHEHEV